MTQDQPIEIYCKICGSTDVTRDAVVSWSVELQQWEISNIYDDGICNTCGAEKSLEERPHNSQVELFIDKLESLGFVEVVGVDESLQAELDARAEQTHMRLQQDAHDFINKMIPLESIKIEGAE